MFAPMIVPSIAMAAVIGGAALHAACNVGIRGGPNRRASTALLALASGLIGAIALPFLPAPAAAAWPHLAATAVLHILYLNLVAEAYSLGAVSLTYPVMRGVAPALTASIAALGFGEHLGIGGWGGLFLISFGVALQAQRSGRPGESRALLFALTNSLVIALYTVNDGLGVRLSHSPLAYALWTFVLPAIPAALLLLRGRISLLFSGDAVPSLLLRGVGRRALLHRLVLARSVGHDPVTHRRHRGAAGDGNAVRSPLCLVVPGGAPWRAPHGCARNDCHRRGDSGPGVTG
jgi:uncharacterized membrane protein